jgi:hypothetical protein
MLVGAIAVGIFVALMTAAIIGELLSPKLDAGIFPGIIAGIWAAWPLLHYGRLDRYNFMNPVPRCYPVPLRQAYSKVRTLLEKKSYNYGDRWKVLSADTQTRSIHAVLQFTVQDIKVEPHLDSIWNIQKERLRRFVDMEITFKEQPDDSTIIQFNFQLKVEGVEYQSCDSIISGLLDEVQTLLGTGTRAGEPVVAHLSAPPIALLAITAIAIVMLYNDISSAVFKP